jgi:predicted MFS family arabinose efflux permease
MVAVQLVHAAVLILLSGAIAADQTTITFILVVMFLLGTAETFADTTATTVLPVLVDKKDLGLGNSRLLAGFITVNQLVGPPVGAALFAADPVLPFLGQIACMLASAALVMRIVLPAPGKKAARTRIGRDIADGIAWLWRNPAVRTLALTIVTFNVTFGAAVSVLVLYARERLHAGNVGFGLLTTATALGGLVGTAAYGWLTARVSLGGLMRAGLIIETVTHLALALTTRAWVALVIMFVFGAHAFVWATTSTSVRQRAVPADLQGRVSSVYLLGVQGGVVLGGFAGGAIADAWGITAPFWVAFVGSAGLVAALWRQLAHIAHADEAQSVPPAA